MGSACGAASLTTVVVRCPGLRQASVLAGKKKMKEVTAYASDSGDRGERLGGQTPLPMVVVVELLGFFVKHTSMYGLALAA